MNLRQILQRSGEDAVKPSTEQPGATAGGQTSSGALVYQQILSAAVLLQDDILQDALHYTAWLADAPPEHFDALYMVAINNFVEFVQSLPHIQHINVQINRGWLQFSLNRAIYGLELTNKFPVPELPGLNREAQLRRIAIWRYANFTAGLYRSIGAICDHFSIDYYDRSKERPHKWNPLQYSLTHAPDAVYYVLTAVNMNPVYPIRNAMSLLLAKQLLPLHGYLWLMSEPDIFSAWLNLLQEQENAGTLWRVVQLAERHVLELIGAAWHIPEHQLAFLYKRHMMTEEEINALFFVQEADAVKAAKQQQQEQELKELFFSWLRENMKEQRITVNQKDSAVHFTKEGLFLMIPQVLQKFASDYPRFGNWISIARMFNRVGLIKLSGADYFFEKYFTGHDNDVLAHKGVILKDATLVFPQAMRNVANTTFEHAAPPAPAVDYNRIFPGATVLHTPDLALHQKSSL